MIRLEKLTWDNYDDVLKLKVAKEQRRFFLLVFIQGRSLSDS